MIPPRPISRLLRQVPEVPTQAEAQAGLRDVLGDPGLELLWMDAEGSYLDADGERTELPFGSRRRAVTSIEHEGRRVGALIHDPRLNDDASTLDEVVAVIGLAIEKDRLNERLRQQRDLLSAIGDGTPALLCLITGGGEIVDEGMNRAGRELLGESHAGLAGRRFWEAVIAPPDRAAGERLIRFAIAGESPGEEMSRWRGVAGDTLVAWSCRGLPAVADRTLFLISGVDVSERERQTQELRESRARLVAAADGERRRLERNLHDGAQQRLVAVSLALRLCLSKLASDQRAAEEILLSGASELELALEELRELARGLHPAMLSERGLDVALASLADRSPVPVELDLDTMGRLTEPVEVATFYLASEALANVAKHAAASSVAIRLRRRLDEVVVEIGDDGVGGAMLMPGSGLSGLADRVAALGGRLEVTSPPGEGTRLRAQIPLAPVPLG